MCENEFFLHEWEPEAMRQIVEGRKSYNREQERLEDEKRRRELKELEIETKRLLEDKEQLQEQNTVNTIKIMLENKLDYDIISKVSGKTIEKIKEIEDSIKEVE